MRHRPHDDRAMRQERMTDASPFDADLALRLIEGEV
jgi:hypothetical protein